MNMNEYCMDCGGHDHPFCSCKNKHPAPELVEFLDKGKAAELHRGGYICISNKYRIIGRPDREDWHIAMADQMRCAPADFIKRDGSGQLCREWREHYIRCTSKDTFKVNENVYTELKRLNNAVHHY